MGFWEVTSDGFEQLILSSELILILPVRSDPDRQISLTCGAPRARCLFRRSVREVIPRAPCPPLASNPQAAPRVAYNPVAPGAQPLLARPLQARPASRPCGSPIGSQSLARDSLSMDPHDGDTVVRVQ